MEDLEDAPSIRGTAYDGSEHREWAKQDIRSSGQLLRFRAAQYLAGFATTLIVARSLGPVGRAHYALPLNLATIVWVTLNLSVELAMARLLSRREAGLLELSRAAVTITMLLGGLGVAATLTLGLFVGGRLVAGATDLSVVLAAATVLPMIGLQLVSALLFRLAALTSYGRIVVVMAALQLLILAIAWRTSALSPETVLAVNLAISILALGGLEFALVSRLGWRVLVPHALSRLVQRTVALGLTLHTSTLALYLNLRIDLVFVSVLIGTRSAGVYSLAVTLGELLMVALSTIGLTMIRRQIEVERDDAIRYTLDFARNSLGLGLVVAVGAAALMLPVILIAYGDAWRGAVTPAIILAFAVIAFAVETPIRGVLLRVASPWSISACACVALTVNVAANLALIPTIGIVGAALASLCSYWTAAVAMLALLARSTRCSVWRAVLVPRRSDLVPAAMAAVGTSARALLRAST